MKIFIFLFSVILFTNVYFTSVSCELVRFTYGSGNVTCLMIEFSGKVNHTIANVSEDIAGTVDTVGNSCGDTSNALQIRGNGYRMRFSFTKVNSSTVLSEVSFTPDTSPNSGYTLDKDMFTVPEEKSFKCDSGITEYLANPSGGIVKMELKEMRFNAFRTAADGTEYEPDSVCAADGGSKTVPMIIAFVLAGMVVIMLVGYIILRKKEDKSTYQTV